LIVVAPWFAEARIRHYRWTVQYEYKSPDCYEKLVITVNGQFPGPTIKAQVGDTIHVDLTNDLETEGVAIHWHGIRQYGTPWSDGTADVTQCPIMPGETFVYKFKVDRPGTFFYHAHYGMQRTAGLHGSIHVAVAEGVKEPFSYDGEHSLLLNDWWHKSHTEQATGLSLPASSFIWVKDPQSLLIEGHGSYDCSLVKSTNNSAGTGSICNSTNLNCSIPYHLSVVPGQTYRLRIANVASLSSLNFLIEGHNLTVVEADSNYVEPFIVQDLNVYPGETYSVLITADQNTSRNYWVAVNVRGSSPSTTPTGRAILRYVPNPSSILPPSMPPKGPIWSDTAYTINQAKLYKARAGYVIAPPRTSHKRIVLWSTQNHVKGFIRWAINNISSVHPHTPFLIAVKYRLNKAFDQFPAPENYSITDSNPNATNGNPIYRSEFNSTVDVILQNGKKLDGSEEIHPWHFHGHDFWVLAQGNGTFDPLKDTEKFNLINPPRKNTVPLFVSGWTAIRFIADNPGVWALHCHIEAHFFLGMGVVFEEGAERIGRLPRSIMGCGETKAFLRY
jgi:L-ascorbate oxidase